MTEQSIANDTLIPMCAEGLLAQRWPAMAYREGHRCSWPSQETAKRQKAQAASSQRKTEAADRRNYSVEGACLAAIRDGHDTVVSVSRAVPMPLENARSAMNRLARRGLIERTGTRKSGTGNATVWAIKRADP